MKESTVDILDNHLKAYVRLIAELKVDRIQLSKGYYMTYSVKPSEIISEDPLYYDINFQVRHDKKHIRLVGTAIYKAHGYGSREDLGLYLIPKLSLAAIHHDDTNLPFEMGKVLKSALISQDSQEIESLIGILYQGDSFDLAFEIWNKLETSKRLSNILRSFTGIVGKRYAEGDMKSFPLTEEGIYNYLTGMSNILYLNRAYFTSLFSIHLSQHSEDVFKTIARQIHTSIEYIENLES